MFELSSSDRRILSEWKLQVILQYMATLVFHGQIWYWSYELNIVFHGQIWYWSYELNLIGFSCGILFIYIYIYKKLERMKYLLFVIALIDMLLVIYLIDRCYLVGSLKGCGFIKISICFSDLNYWSNSLSIVIAFI